MPSTRPVLLRTSLLAGAALVVLMAIAQPEKAATPPTPPAQPPPPRAMPVPERQGLLTGMEPEQRQAVMETLRRTQQENQGQVARLRQLRRELQSAAWAEKPDAELIQSHARQIGELEGQIATSRARAAAVLRPRLKPEQIERLRNAGPELWETAFGGGFARGPAAPGRTGVVERPNVGTAGRTPPPPSPVPPPATTGPSTK